MPHEGESFVHHSQDRGRLPKEDIANESRKAQCAPNERTVRRRSEGKRETKEGRGRRFATMAGWIPGKQIN